MISRPFVGLLFLLILCCLSACGTFPERGHYLIQAETNYQQKGMPRVLLVNSNQRVERYQIAQNVFASSIKDYAEVESVDLENENKPTERLQDILNRTRFDAIYCIGAKALGSIDYLDPDVNVVYSSVLNWRRFKDRPNFYGISSELSPQVQLTWFKYLFPHLKNVSVLYSDENQKLIADAKAVSENLGLSLNAQKVRPDYELSVFAKDALEKADALWLISDSATISSEHDVELLFQMAKTKQVPVISYSPLFMELGSMMSLVADLPTTARQAALLMMRLLDNEHPDEQIQYPAGSRIIVNSKLIQTYRLKLNPDALDSVDEIR